VLQWAFACAAAAAVVCVASLGQAHDSAERAREAPELSPDTKIEIAPQPPEPKLHEVTTPDESPPVAPRPTGLVVESSLGALGFVGQFRHLAPTASWFHGQLGYEPTRGLMFFGEGELAFTDTSEATDSSHVVAFPLWGIGGGVRGTLHASKRVAAFVQMDLDAVGADVPHDTLAIYGFPHVESLGAAFGARVGLEWYQVDRHIAIGIQAGGRYASSFAKSLASSDIPLLWDAAACLRYAF
jgi:hypothetical protein